MASAQASLALKPVEEWRLVVHGHIKQSFHFTEYRKQDDSRYHFIQFVRGERVLAEELVSRDKWQHWQQALSRELSTKVPRKGCREALSWGKSHRVLQLPKLCLDGVSSTQLTRLNQLLNELSAYVARSP